MSETYTATLDRVEDGQIAVLLLEEDGEIIEQLDVDIERLPEDGQREGAVLEVTVEEGDFQTAEYLPNATQSRRESMQDRFDRLSSDFSDRG